MAEVKREGITIIAKGVTLEAISLIFTCYPYLRRMTPLESGFLLIHRYFLLNLHAFVLIFIIHLRNESIFQFGPSTVDGGIHSGG